MNTAIERVVDDIGMERRDLAKQAKDAVTAMVGAAWVTILQCLTLETPCVTGRYNQLSYNRAYAVGYGFIVNRENASNDIYLSIAWNLKYRGVCRSHCSRHNLNTGRLFTQTLHDQMP